MSETTPEVPESGTPVVPDSGTPAAPAAPALPAPGAILGLREVDAYADPPRERVALHLVVHAEMRQTTNPDGTALQVPRVLTRSLGYADECADHPLSAFAPQ